MQISDEPVYQEIKIEWALNSELEIIWMKVVMSSRGKIAWSNRRLEDELEMGQRKELNASRDYLEWWGVQIPSIRMERNGF